MHCFSSRVTSWLTWTLRVGGFVLRRRIGASVIRPLHLRWPTQQQRRAQEAVAVLGSQTIPWDRHRQIKGKFCTVVGGVYSPLLANLFLHYAFDCWMARVYPDLRFERYADDALVHCGSEAEAQSVLEALRGRLAECGLELHPTKTRVVYCKDDDRPGCEPPSSIRTEPWRSGRGAPRKGAPSHRSWPTSSCTTRSIDGWRGFTRTSGSSATRTMRSSIAGARRRRGLCWRRSGVAWRNAVWSFIPRRPGSSTARTTTGRGRTNTSRSTSSATPSNRDGRRTGGGGTASASSRRSAPKPRRRSGRPSAAGGWRPPGTTSAWRIWLAL